jgi:hypothetical protein
MTRQVVLVWFLGSDVGEVPLVPGKNTPFLTVTPILLIRVDFANICCTSLLGPQARVVAALLHSSA